MAGFCKVLVCGEVAGGAEAILHLAVGKKIGTQNGTLKGNMDEHLRCFGLILTHTHLF